MKGEDCYLVDIHIRTEEYFRAGIIRVFIIGAIFSPE